MFSIHRLISVTAVVVAIACLSGCVSLEQRRANYASRCEQMGAAGNYQCQIQLEEIDNIKVQRALDHLSCVGTAMGAQGPSRVPISFAQSFSMATQACR